MQTAPKYVPHDGYFIDGLHLNARGADKFTKELIGVIRCLIKEE